MGSSNRNLNAEGQVPRIGNGGSSKSKESKIFMT